MSMLFLIPSFTFLHLLFHLLKLYYFTLWSGSLLVLFGLKSKLMDTLFFPWFHRRNVITSWKGAAWTSETCWYLCQCILCCQFFLHYNGYGGFHHNMLFYISAVSYHHDNHKSVGISSERASESGGIPQIQWFICGYWKSVPESQAFCLILVEMLLR